MIASLDLRLSFLKAFGRLEIQNLSNLVQAEIQRATHNTLGSLLTRYLSFELVYCLKKYQAWLGNPLFQHLLVHHLANDFKINLGSAEAILTSILKTQDLVTTDNLDYLDERNFLLYLIVNVLNCRNPDLLSDEIGLGSGLLNLIRDALKVTTSQEIFLFAPTLTSQSLSVLHELAEEYRKNRSIASIYQIFFALFATPDALKIFDRKQLAMNLFAVLLHLGIRKQMSYVEFREKLDAIHHDLGRHWEMLLDFLKRNIFIFEPHSSAQKMSSPRLHLSFIGHELTAEAFASRQQKEVLRPERFYSLHPTWQLTLIHSWPAERLPELWTCIQLGHYLPPPAIAAIYERFKHLAQTETWRTWLEKTASFAGRLEARSFTDPTKTASSSTKIQTFRL